MLNIKAGESARSATVPDITPDTDPDITALSLRGASIALRDLATFTIGQVSVNRESLLREGTNTQAKVVLEAIALGNLMLNRNRRWWLPNSSQVRVSLVEPERPTDTDEWNMVLGTSPSLKSPTKDANGLPGSHSWKFRTYADRSAFVIGPKTTALVGVGIYGTLKSSLPPGESQIEDYRIALSGVENDVRVSDLRQPEFEEPNGLFYVAQLGLLRAARIELGDKSAASVIE
jgi:hypothetical protein